jgi:hypothetical protein
MVEIDNKYKYYGAESEFRNALDDAKVHPTIANELIACLRDAVVVFGP